MVALDGCRFAAGLACAGLNDVRVDGALCKHLHVADLLGLVEEYLPELGANETALLLGVCHAGEHLGIALLGVHVHERHVELLAENLLDHLGLALAKHAVVHKHASELVSDGTVHQGRHHGGVNSAREGENHLTRPNLLADLLDLLVDDALHGPVLLEVAHAEQEVLEHARAILGVAHFRVELRGEEATARALHNGHGAGVRTAGDHEALGRAAHGVAVAHPHRLATLGRAVEKDRRAKARERCRAILALVGVCDLATKLDGHDLLAIAEAQDGDAQLEDTRVHVGRTLGVDRGRAAGENDGRGCHCGKLVGRDVTGDNF